LKYFSTKSSCSTQVIALIFQTDVQSHSAVFGINCISQVAQDCLFTILGSSQDSAFITFIKSSLLAHKETQTLSSFAEKSSFCKSFSHFKYVPSDKESAFCIDFASIL